MVGYDNIFWIVDICFNFNIWFIPLKERIFNKIYELDIFDRIHY
jgi:hypothetical protein